MAAAHLAIGFAPAIVALAAHAVTPTLERDTFAQIRTRHAGKPLVVHLWGTSCGPCLVELPRWGTLGRQRPDLDLVLIQVDVSPVGAAEDVLAKASLGNVERWRVEAPPDEFVRASIDRTWRGDMPRTLLVAPNGATTVLRGSADLAAVARWLEGYGKRE